MLTVHRSPPVTRCRPACARAFAGDSFGALAVNDVVGAAMSVVFYQWASVQFYSVRNPCAHPTLPAGVPPTQLNLSRPLLWRRRARGCALPACSGFSLWMLQSFKLGFWMSLIMDRRVVFCRGRDAAPRLRHNSPSAAAAGEARPGTRAPRSFKLGGAD